MKLADVMDKVEVGMKMVVRSEYNPEYEVFGGKVVEKKGVYLCLEVDGILHGLSAKENYEVLKLFDPGQRFPPCRPDCMLAKDIINSYSIVK